MIRNTNIWKRVLTILTTGVLGITTVLFPSPYVSAMEEDDAIENVIQEDEEGFAISETYCEPSEGEIKCSDEIEPDQAGAERMLKVPYEVALGDGKKNGTGTIGYAYCHAAETGVSMRIAIFRDNKELGSRIVESTTADKRYVTDFRQYFTETGTYHVTVSVYSEMSANVDPRSVSVTSDKFKYSVKKAVDTPTAFSYDNSTGVLSWDDAGVSRYAVHLGDSAGDSVNLSSTEAEDKKRFISSRSVYVGDLMQSPKFKYAHTWHVDITAISDDLSKLRSAEAQFLPGTTDDSGEKKYYSPVFYVEGYEKRVTYTGYPVSFPNLTVKNYAARLLTEGTDYTISYKNNTNAGRAAIVITGKGLYGADQDDHLKEVDFYIDPADISGEDIRTSPVNMQFTSGMTLPVPEVSKGTLKLIRDKDYTVEGLYKDETRITAVDAPGTYYYLLQGKGNYTGSRKAYCYVKDTLNAVDMSKVSVTKPADRKYNGDKFIPRVESLNVNYMGTPLVENEDFTVEYIDETNDNDEDYYEYAGTKKLILRGMDGASDNDIIFTGTKEVTWKIQTVPLKQTKLEKMEDQNFYNDYLYPDPTIKYFTQKNRYMTLKNNIDYTLSFKNNREAGKASVKITGKGNFTGSLTTSFKINPIYVENETGTYDLDFTAVCNGKSFDSYDTEEGIPYEVNSKPDIRVYVGYGWLPKSDYTVKLINWNKPGKTAKAEIYFKKSIRQKDNGPWASLVLGTVSAPLDRQYLTAKTVFFGKSGTAMKKYMPKPVVNDSKGARLSLNRDYKILGYYYAQDTLLTDPATGGTRTAHAGDEVNATDVLANTTEPVCINIGVTAEGAKTQNFSGTLYGTYRIISKESDISKCDFSYSPLLRLYYTGNPITMEDYMSINGSESPNGKKRILVEGEDYTVEYKNNIKPGTMTVTYKGIGAFSGKKEFKFKIENTALDITY